MHSWAGIYLYYFPATRCTFASFSALIEDVKLGHNEGSLLEGHSGAQKLGWKMVTRASSVFYRPVRWSLKHCALPFCQWPLVFCWGVRIVQPYEYDQLLYYYYGYNYLCIARANAPLRANILLPVLPVPIIVRPFFSFVFEWFTTACWRAHEANVKVLSSFPPLPLLTCRTFFKPDFTPWCILGLSFLMLELELWQCCIYQGLWISGACLVSTLCSPGTWELLC